MSEKETAEIVAARLYRYCKREYDCPHPSVDDVEEALTAAEERGRRAGIEEAAKDIEALRDALVDALDAVHKASVAITNALNSSAGTARKYSKAALAPRGSSPATGDYQGCGDPAHDCRDGVCGAGPVPRDSGKEDRK